MSGSKVNVEETEHGKVVSYMSYGWTRTFVVVPKGDGELAVYFQNYLEHDDRVHAIKNELPNSSNLSVEEGDLKGRVIVTDIETMLDHQRHVKWVPEEMQMADFQKILEGLPTIHGAKLFNPEEAQAFVKAVADVMDAPNASTAPATFPNPEDSM